MCSVSQTIRDSIGRLGPGNLVTTRQLLHIGSRRSVDVTLWRLVAAGTIRRFANGVFGLPLIGKREFQPTAYDVAKAKADAYGKVLLTHSTNCAHEIGLARKKDNQYYFAATGCKTKFQFNGTYIRFVGTSSRKLNVGDSTIGKFLRAIWFAGKKSCTQNAEEITKVCARVASANPPRQSAWLPTWLREFLTDCGSNIEFRPYVSAT